LMQRAVRGYTGAMGDVDMGAPTVGSVVRGQAYRVEELTLAARALGGYRWREQWRCTDRELEERLETLRRRIVGDLARAEIREAAWAGLEERLCVAEAVLRELGREAYFEARLREAGEAVDALA